MGPKKPEGQSNADAPPAGVVGGAALVGATAGLLLSGPLVAIGLGAGAAACCLRKDQAGDVARSTGQAGLAVVEKGKEINTQYGVADKVKGAAHSTFERAKEVNEEHKVVDKAKAGVSRAWARIREVSERLKALVLQILVAMWHSPRRFGLTVAMIAGASSRGYMFRVRRVRMRALGAYTLPIPGLDLEYRAQQ
ncbi:unnamed protein product [Ectocarpus sp. 12 AP-2014]